MVHHIALYYIRYTPCIKTYQTLLCRFEGLGRELTGIVDLQIWKRAYSIYGSNRERGKRHFVYTNLLIWSKSWAETECS